MARIDGITKGGSLMNRLVFLFTKWKFGKVTTPLRIKALHRRLFRGYAQMEWAQMNAKLLPPSLKSLAQIRAATVIGCPY